MEWILNRIGSPWKYCRNFRVAYNRCRMLKSVLRTADGPDFFPSRPSTLRASRLEDTSQHDVYGQT